MYDKLKDVELNERMSLGVIFRSLKKVYLRNGDLVEKNKQWDTWLIKFPLDFSQDLWLDEIIVVRKDFSLHWNIELRLNPESKPIFKEPFTFFFWDYNKKNAPKISFQEYELLKKINHYKRTRFLWTYYYDFGTDRIIVMTALPILVNISYMDMEFYEREIVALIGMIRKDIIWFLYS